jgi:sugar phosphate isomerase/epimerase
MLLQGRVIVQQKIGFIGILKDEFEADAQGTLDWVASLGFDGMEGAASLAGYLGVDVSGAKRALEEAGLAAGPQGRVAFEQTEDEWLEVIRTAKEIGSAYVVDYYAPFNDETEIKRYCDYFNRVGKLCADEGLVFLYHNHDHEFRRVNGTYGFDIMLEHSDPDLVSFELDVAWVTFGGADPVALIKQHADRIPVLHMKDFEHLHPGTPNAEGVRKEAVFAEVGSGVVNTAAVVEAAKDADVEWLVIEQDRMNKLGPRESLELSYNNLRALVD